MSWLCLPDFDASDPEIVHDAAGNLVEMPGSLDSRDRSRDVLRMAWKVHRFAEFKGWPVHFGMACGCTRVLTSRYSYFMSRLDDDATPRDAERRMRCQTCHERPKLSLEQDWGVIGGRDRRVEPPEYPEWMPFRLDRR